MIDRQDLRAYSIEPGRVIIRISQTEHSFELAHAIEILRDLQSAIFHAQQFTKLQGESAKNND